MISIEEFLDLSQLIGPLSTMIWVRLVENSIHLVAPINYSHSNPFINSGPTSAKPQSDREYDLTHYMLYTLDSRKASFDHREVGTEQVLEINGVTKTGWVYQPKDLKFRGKKKKGEEGPNQGTTDEEASQRTRHHRIH